MPDYGKGKIYKIVCNTSGKVYVGSTTKDRLCQRLAKHVDHYKQWKAGKGNKTSSFDIIENGNYEIILLEDHPCSSKDQLHARERHFIESLECVNEIKRPIRNSDEKNSIKQHIEKPIKNKGKSGLQITTKPTKTYLKRRKKHTTKRTKMSLTKKEV